MSVECEHDPFHAALLVGIAIKGDHCPHDATARLVSVGGKGEHPPGHPNRRAELALLRVIHVLQQPALEVECFQATVLAPDIYPCGFRLLPEHGRSMDIAPMLLPVMKDRGERIDLLFGVWVWTVRCGRTSGKLPHVGQREHVKNALLSAANDPRGRVGHQHRSGRTQIQIKAV